MEMRGERDGSEQKDLSPEERTKSVLLLLCSLLEAHVKQRRYFKQFI